MLSLFQSKRLLNAEIEIEKLRLENETLLKKLKEAEEAIQILAANQAYLAKEVTEIRAETSRDSAEDPMDKYLRGLVGGDDEGGGYLN
mgnify:CR=1 FL=1